MLQVSKVRSRSKGGKLYPGTGEATHVPVQTRELPLPALAKPAVQVHPDAPAALVLPAGHEGQVADPAVALYVLASQTVEARRGRRRREGGAGRVEARRGRAGRTGGPGAVCESVRELRER